MKITAECTIDLDSKRRVWMQAGTDDVDPEDARAAADALCAAAANGAMAAYDHALENNPELGKRPQVKDPMAAMQDD